MSIDAFNNELSYAIKINELDVTSGVTFPAILWSKINVHDSMEKVIDFAKT